MSTTLLPTAPSTRESSRSATVQVEQRLDGLKRSVRRGTWFRGLLVLAAATLLTLLAVLVADALWQPESAGARLLLVGSGLAVVAAVAKRFVVAPLRRGVSRLDVAWQLEEEHPEWEERLTSTLQLAHDGDENGPSARLIGLVAEQAEERFVKIEADPTSRPRLQPALIALGVSGLLLLLASAGWQRYLLPSLSNVFNPWGDRVLPRLDATVTPGDASLTDGDSVTIAAAGRNLRDARLEIVEDGKVVSSHPMIADDNGRQAEFALAEVRKDLRYRVRAGRLYSPEFGLEVLARPVIDRVAVRLEFPEYTRLAPSQIEDARTPLDVPLGARVTVSAISATRAAKAVMNLAGSVREANRVEPSESGDGWRHVWELTVDDKLNQPATLVLVSERQVESTPRTIHFRPIADRPPTIAAEMRGLTRVAVKPGENLTVPFVATDDHGLSALSLLTQKAGEPVSSEPLPLAVFTKQHQETATLDLSKFDLKPNDTLTFWLRATDNRPENLGGGQSTDSQQIEIHIDSQAGSVEEQAIREQRVPLDQKLAAALDKLKGAQEVAEQLTKADAPAAEQKVAQVRDRIEQAKRELDKLSQAAESSPLFKPEIAAAEQVAKNEVPEAQRQAEQLSQQAGQQQREQAEHVKAKLDEAVRKLEQVQADVRKRNDELQMAAKLDDLARQQERLAEEMRRREAGKDAARKAETNKERQQKVAGDLQDLVKKDLDAKSEQFQKRAEQADQLAKEAGELQKQQDQLARMNKTDSKETPDLKARKRQINEMLAREQQAVADQTKKLEQEQGKNENRPANPKDGLPQARANMEEAADQMRKEQPEKAEQAARKALENLKENKPAGEKNPDAVKPDAANPQGKNQQQKEQLARQQQRIAEAIEAARKNDLDKAAEKLQEQLADRTKQLEDKSRELLKQPTDDPENKKAVEEAARQLQKAQEDTKQAEQFAKRDAEVQQPKPQDKGDNKPGEKKPADNKPGEKGEQKPGENKPGEQKPGENKPQEKGENKPQDKGEQKAGDKPRDKGEQKPGEKKPGDNKPQDKGEQKPGDKKPGEQKPGDNKPQDKEEVAKQQEKAADSLKKAAESLNTVCKSCQKCAKCNNPGGSGGSNPGDSQAPDKPGQKESEKPSPNPGDGRPQAEKPSEKEGKSDKTNSGKQGEGSKPGQDGKPQQKSGQPDSKLLAKAADAANEAAQSPSKESTEKAAREVNKLADQAADQANYPFRKQDKPDPPKGGSTGGNAAENMKAGGRTPGKTDLDNVTVGGNSSNGWTRSGKKLQGNVLEDKEAKIPEGYKGVVQDYFEELSRLGSQPKSEKKDGGK